MEQETTVEDISATFDLLTYTYSSYQLDTVEVG